MLATGQKVVADWFGGLGESVEFDDAVLCHHNHVARETYDGQELIVTRKGAIRAARGDRGLIPGSMGTGSYVVRGLGNEQSLNSASHGAGRRMSRGQAKRTFTTEDLAAQTAGIECRKDAGVVDEIPGAFKDINAVMAAPGRPRRGRGAPADPVVRQGLNREGCASARCRGSIPI